MELELGSEDHALLQRLEEELWQEETRFDVPYMERIIAADFFEFGRSGRVYNRIEILYVPKQPIDAVIPLPNFQARLLTAGVALVTHNSHVIVDGIVEKGRRSSIWSRMAAGWTLRFHQGTPYEDDVI